MKTKNNGVAAKLSQQDILKYVHQVPIFSGLDEKQITFIASFVQAISYLAGNFLFHESMPRKGIFLIVHGTVEILKGIGDHPVQLTVLGQGKLLGERILLSKDIPHMTSARALSDVTVIFLHKDELLKIQKKDSETYLRMIESAGVLLAQRLAYIPGLAPIERTRQEQDLLGERDLPERAMYGIQTLRAMENFPISGIPIRTFPNLIKALAMVKKAAALANEELNLLEPEKCRPICQACDEIIEGEHHQYFVVDVIQGGAGTSSNMNANEVIANRALEILGYPFGRYDIVHPNNHVNLSQSTNDAYPTSMRVGLLFALQMLVTGMEELRDAFQQKSIEFSDVIKMGRTQLQDAIPMTLGQEFSAFSTMIDEDISRVSEAMQLLKEINLGATAIGTGLNAPPGYSDIVCKYLTEITQLDLKTAVNLVEATQDTGAYVQLSGVLKRVAVKLSKICNDLRLLSSGPRAGIHEINLPPMQPGSSIMPGKVNPVIPEVVNQVAFEVVGHDVTVTMAAEAGQLQLNVMEPIIAYSLFSSINHLRQACIVLSERTVKGISANKQHARDLVESSIGLVTALNPYIGYEKSSEVAKEALSSGRKVYDIVLEKGYLSREQLDHILKPENMVQPIRS
ncbi:MAG: aspartate ammonia-lyase [Candidatus Zhuqueibacterota bacterium]